VVELSDYESKKIKRHILFARGTIHFFAYPFIGVYAQRKMQEKIKNFHLRRENMEAVSVLIRNAGRCAVGERVCASLSKNSPITESVFLDELADAMIKSGQARQVSGDEAIKTLEKYPKNPLIVACISGKKQEICRSYPEECIYWNLKKKGFEF
jgi:hypothetical protein